MEIKEEEQIWKTKYTENFHKKTPFPLVKYKYCLFHPTNDNVVYTLAKVKLQDDVRLELFCPKNTSKELNLIIEKLKESHLDRLQSPVEMEKVNNVDESNSTSQINEKADRGYSDGFMMQYFTHNQEILANEYDESDSDYIDNPPSHKYEKKKFGTFEMGTFIPFEEVEETLEIDVTKKALDILDKNRQKMYNSPDEGISMSKQISSKGRFMPNSTDQNKLNTQAERSKDYTDFDQVYTEDSYNKDLNKAKMLLTKWELKNTRY